MSEATKRAKDLLAAYRLQCKCSYPAKVTECKTCEAQIHADIILGEKREETLAAAIALAEGYEGRCWHQEMYEERDDGASDIYPDIMHEGKCSDQTECEPCGACKALAEFDALFPEEANG